MTITITADRSFTAGAVQWLMMQTDWARNRPIEDVAQLLMNTSMSVGAWDDDRDEMVGYARVLTDWTYRAFIEDVIVDEAYRGRGVGKALIKYMLQRLTTVEEIILTCSEKHIPFYTQFGFKLTDHNQLHIFRGVDG